MVFTLHGVVNKIISGCQSTRSFVEQAEFEIYLKGRKSFFGKWDSNSKDLDILTVDDATIAGANACLIARSLGHHAILFINPWQIIYRKPYYLNLLNIAIDNRKISSILYDGNEYNLESYKGRKKFRFLVKQKLIIMNPTDAINYVEKISGDLKSSSLNMPEYSRTLTISEIEGLQKVGVQIESHGWSHKSIAAFNSNDLLLDITSSTNWINETLNKECSMYAVPFGKPKVQKKVLSEINLDCFLSDPLYLTFKVEAGCWNRYEITSDLRDKP